MQCLVLQWIHVLRQYSGDFGRIYTFSTWWQTRFLKRSNAANPKRRRVEPGGGNFARLPRPVSLWTSDWYQLPVACIGEGDIALRPFSVSLLFKTVHFLGSLHRPRGVDDLGIGGGFPTLNF